MNQVGSKRGAKRHWARRWHRWLGVVFAIPLLWLTVSGLVLRHADRLGLHEARVKSGWLLQNYGLIPESEARGVVVGGRTVSEWGETLFLDGVVLEEAGELVGAVGSGRDLVLATGDYLLVYDSAGMLVDQLGEESLPVVPVERVGVDLEGAVVMGGAGKQWKIAEDFLSHEPYGDWKVGWSEVEPLAAADQARLEALLAEQAGISFYRLWLDLHSGNLFGAAGRWAVDLSGIGIVVLTLLGLRIVLRKGRTGDPSRSAGVPPVEPG